MSNETEQIINFLRTVYQRSDPAICERMQTQLYDYAVAFVNWNKDRLRFAELRQHLDACVACSEAYARVFATVNQPQTSPDIVIPNPDLSFLTPTQSLSQRIHEALSQIGNHVRLQLSADLLPALRPALATSALRSAQHQPYGELLLQLDPPADLVERWPINVKVYRDAQDPALSLLEVSVAPPDRNWPDLAEITVEVKIGSENRLQETDAFGTASFANIPIDQLPAVTISVTL